MLTKHPLIVVASLIALYYLVFVCSLSFNNVLGKFLIIATVLGITYCYGKVAGVVSAICGILILHRSIEGMENESAESSDDKQPTEEIDIEETETVTESEEPSKKEETAKDESDEEDEAATQEKAASAVSNDTIVSHEEKMRPKSSNDVTEGFASFGLGSHIEPMSLYSSSESFAPAH